MKEVIAVIRMNKMNQTKQALTDAGISGFHARPVFGRGKGLVDFTLLQGASEGHEEAISQLKPGIKLIPKRMISLMVPDDKVSLVVKTMIKANQSGRAGDGKIFVLPMDDAVRVRTGEMGDVAIDEIA